jgi:hypothetical protein
VSAGVAAVKALRECRLDLLHAAVTAAHARLYVSGAREVVGKVDEAVTIVNRLLVEAEGHER